MSRHLSILKAAGIINERRDANRIYYRLDDERLAASVGAFLSAVCPVDVVARRQRTRSRGVTT